MNDRPETNPETIVFINAGAALGPRFGKGWTNTYEQAKKNAQEWFDRMLKDGFADIELIDRHRQGEGRWLFAVRHKITGVEVELDMHGIDNVKAYQDEKIFDPRVYWNKSSSGTPKLKDFAAKGFHSVKTYRR